MRKLFKTIGKWGFYIAVSALLTAIFEMPTPIFPKDKEEK